MLHPVAELSCLAPSAEAGVCACAKLLHMLCKCTSGMQMATIDAGLTAKQLTVSVSQQICCLALQPCQLLHASQMCSAHSPFTTQSAASHHQSFSSYADVACVAATTTLSGTVSGVSSVQYSAGTCTIPVQPVQLR